MNTRAGGIPWPYLIRVPGRGTMARAGRSHTSELGSRSERLAKGLAFADNTPMVLRLEVRMRIVVAAALTLLSITHARADFFSGSDLLEMCNASPIRVDFYVAGLSDISGPDNSQERTPKSIHPFCIPKDVGLVQMREVACKYLADATPQRRHLGGSALVRSSFVAAFPCR
jgi:hypothetical protein